MNQCVKTEGKYNESVNNEFKIIKKSLVNVYQILCFVDMFVFAFSLSFLFC